jgi:hypothetical protein
MDDGPASGEDAQAVAVFVSGILRDNDPGTLRRLRVFLEQVL